MAPKTGTGFSLKDHLFNRERVQYLADLLAGAVDGFNKGRFVRDVIKPFPSLELKQRIAHIAETLKHHLAKDFRDAAKQITAALPPPLDPSKTDDDFGDFIFAPLGEFVVRNGIDHRNLKLSLKTIHALTQRFSMEDAIRWFINAHTESTLETLAIWANDKNYHVRRLVSEGTRPSLPWSARIGISVETALPLLDALFADPTRYVTRSVANHLNDISKTQPLLVVATLKRWRQQKSQREAELDWMSKHALRTLVKQGHAGALKLLGFRSQPKIEVDNFAISAKKIRPGETVQFSFTVKALRSEALIVDYVIDFVKANGELSPKVHKLKTLKLKIGEDVTVTKRHKLHANATTYTLYPGTHRITIQINGSHWGTKTFELA